MARKKKLTDDHKEKLLKARKDSAKTSLKIESDTFVIRSDKLNWIAEFDGDTIYHSSLDALCISLLERKLKRAEVHSIQGLKDAINQACDEICFITPKMTK